MYIPGFTAEASVAGAEMHFVGEISSAMRDAQQVVAQAQRVRYPVDCDNIECQQLGGHWMCYCA